MATEKKEQESKEIKEQGTTIPGEKQLPDDVKEAVEKKGWFQNLGTGAKVGLCAVGTAVLAGAVWFVTNLFGGKDEDEPEAIEAGDDETTEE